MPPIPPNQLAAFAGKKKQDDAIDEEDEGAIDELDVEAGDDLEDEDVEEEEGDEEEIDVVAIGDQVQDGEWPDKDLMERAKGVSEENNPPSWALDEDLWEKAKEAVEDRWDEYDEPYAVVSAVYQKMGGVIEGAGGEE